MEIDLALVAHHLHARNPVSVDLQPNGPGVVDARMCPAAAEERDALGDTGRTLFIGSFEQFTAIDFAPPHALCTGGADQAAAYFAAHGSEALVLPAGERAQSMLNEVFDLFRRINGCEQLLVESVLAGSDISIIIDVCSRFFKNPTFILNEALRVVASCTSYKHDPADPTWRETEKTGYISRQLLSAMAEANILHTLETSHEVIFVELEGFPRRLVANVFSHGRRFISLCVDEVTSPLSMLQASLIERLANMIGTYLQTNGKNLGFQPISFVDSVRAIIRSETVDPSDVKAFLRLRDWRETDGYTVVVMRPSNRQRELGIAHFSLQTAAEHFADAVLVEDESDLVAIVHHGPEAEDDSRIIDKAFERTLIEEGVSCGVSMLFRGFFLIHDEYLLARAAIDIAQRDGMGAGVHHIEDHLTDYMLDLCAKTIDIACLCDPGMVALHEYDRRHKTELARSVAVYLEMGSSIVRAAEALFIHRNTLVYRLNRACSVAGIDLGGQAVSRLIISHRILCRKDAEAAD